MNVLASIRIILNFKDKPELLGDIYYRPNSLGFFVFNYE